MYRCPITFSIQIQPHLRHCNKCALACLQCAHMKATLQPTTTPPPTLYSVSHVIKSCLWWLMPVKQQFKVIQLCITFNKIHTCGMNLKNPTSPPRSQVVTFTRVFRELDLWPLDRGHIFLNHLRFFSRSTYWSQFEAWRVLLELGYWNRMPAENDASRVLRVNRNSLVIQLSS